MMETYVKIPDRIMSRKKLSPAAKLLYGLLMSLCQSRGYCWATNSALAERLGMGRKSMTRLLGELREHGLVYYDKTGGTGAERNTKRLLRLTEPEEIAPDESGDISGEGDVDSSRDFGGWLNQCIARMEQAKRQWAQTHPRQPEYGDSADLGQELQVASTPKTAGDAGFGVAERRDVRSSSQPETPGNADFRGQEVRPTVPVNAPGNTGFAVPERRDVRPATPVKTPDFSGFTVPERREVRSFSQPRTPGHVGFAVPERQERQTAALSEMPGNADFRGQEQREVQPSAPVKAPAHSGFTVPERQEIPKSDRPLTAPQTMPPQTDPVLSNWIQIRHRDWSQEDRAQFSGFWQTYWQERQQQGYPYPEKPARHRFLERVNLLSDGDRATMQDILRHHRISQ